MLSYSYLSNFPFASKPSSLAFSLHVHTLFDARHKQLPANWYDAPLFSPGLPAPWLTGQTRRPLGGCALL